MSNAGIVTKKMILSVVFILFTASLLYWETIKGMVHDWNTDPNYSHGFLIPIMSGYFAWQLRGKLRAIDLRPANGGIVVIVGGLALFLVGYLAGEYFSMRSSLILVLTGALVYLAGWASLRILAFPLAFLAFMIPLPYLIYDSFAFPLKMFVTRVSVDVLHILGLTVLRSGNIIELPSTTLEVADACSGMRSIISLLALATAIAHTMMKGWWRKSAIVLLAVPVAVVVNALRVIITGILANRYGSRAAEGFYHEFAGLVIFGVAIIMMGGIAWVLSRVGAEQPTTKEQS